MIKKINKKVIKVVLSILLLTSFYNAKSMLSPSSLTPFTKIITIGSKFLSKKYCLLENWLYYKCSPYWYFPYIKELIEQGYIEEAKNIINKTEKRGETLLYDTLDYASCNEDLERAKLLLPYCTEDTIKKVLNKILNKVYLSELEYQIITELLFTYCTKNTINQAKPKLSELFSKLCERRFWKLNSKLLTLKCKMDNIEYARTELKKRIIDNNHKIETLRELDANLCSEDKTKKFKTAKHEAKELLFYNSDATHPYRNLFQKEHAEYTNEIQKLENENEYFLIKSEKRRQKFVNLSKEMQDIQAKITEGEDEIKKQLCLID